MEEYRTPDERAARALESIAASAYGIAMSVAVIAGIVLGHVLANVLIK